MGLHVKLKFSTDVIVKEITKDTIDAMNLIVREYKEEVDSITPEDTLKLLLNNSINSAHIENGKIVASVYNDTPYALDVEYGVTGLEYNYHKPKGVTIYTGEGNRTFARALDNKEYDLIQKLARG